MLDFPTAHFIMFPGITCSDLDDPQYGSVKVSGITPGSKADYRCNRDFKLVGVAQRKCQDNGQWTGEAPVCKRKETVKSEI